MIQVINIKVDDFQIMIENAVKSVLVKENLIQKFEKIYTINELSKLNIIGRYRAIKTLIKNGELDTLKDGKISHVALKKYLESKK